MYGLLQLPARQARLIAAAAATPAPHKVKVDRLEVPSIEPYQNRTIAIASDFRVDGAKSPEIPHKEGVLGSEIAA